MIEAEVHRNDEIIMHRTYYEPSLSLEMVIRQLEVYIVGEQLNRDGECLIRVRFPNAAK